MIELKKVNRHFKMVMNQSYLKDIDIHIDEGNLSLLWDLQVQVRVRSSIF